MCVSSRCVTCVCPLQVCKVCALYSEGTGLKVVMVGGQKSFAAEQGSLAEQR